MNIMLSKILGGIEQSFLDYEQIISLSGHTPINVISQGALITSQLNSFETVPNFFQYDPITLAKLRYLVFKHRPEIVLAHGSRVMKNLSIALKGSKVKIIGISHQYKPKPLMKCHYAISITNHMKGYLVQHGVKEENITVIPNSIKITQDYIPYQARKPIIIGSMGRFVAKKGFDTMLQAFKILKDKGIKFKGIIGGNGEEDINLKQLCTRLNLDDYVTFPGWVKDKSKFFESFDIFCLPSLHEPFGIIMLEAMMYSKPIITSDSEGPLEIIQDGIEGIFFEKGNATQLASRMEQLFKDQELCTKLAKNAYLRVNENYAINKAADKFKELLAKIA